MASWQNNEQPFGVNHAPLLSGLASDGSGTEVPVAVDKDTGELLVSGGSSGDNASVGPTGSAVPADATYIGGNLAGSGSLTGVNVQSFGSDGIGNSDIGLQVGAKGYVYNAGNADWDRLRSASAAAGTTGTGLLGAGILGFDGTDWQYVSIDGSHNLKVTVNNLGPGAGIGNVGTQNAAVNVGQQTVSTTAVQVSSTSTAPTNGIIIRALAANAANIYVGGSGVTTSTGYELAPGESVSFTCNLNTLFIRSVASTTDKVCWNVE